MRTDGDLLLHGQVYGTKYVRVGDISIIPLHIAAHTQGTNTLDLDGNRYSEANQNTPIVAAAYSIAEQRESCILQHSHSQGFSALTTHCRIDTTSR